MLHELPNGASKALVCKRLAGDLFRHLIDGDADRADKGLPYALLDDPFQQGLPSHELRLTRDQPGTKTVALPLAELLEALKRQRPATARPRVTRR
jgi:hypothetical protein